MKGDVRHLLAGYATGTLTEAERKELFEAALDDPELFAQIAGDEPLRELLASPAARAELLERVEPAAPGFGERLAAWLRRPAILGAVGTLAAAVVALWIAPLVRRADRRPTEIASIAVRRPMPEAAPEPVADQPPPVAATPAAKPAAKPPRGAAPNIEATPKTYSMPQRVSAEEQPQRSKLFLAREKEAPPPAVVPAAPPSLPAAVLAPKAPAAESNAPRPVRYEIEARSTSGAYVAVANGTTLNDGDIVRVRFRPATTGLLVVREEAIAEPLVSRVIQAGVEATTEPIRMNRDRRLEVAFTAVAAGDVSEPIAAVQAETAGKGMSSAIRAAPQARMARMTTQFLESPAADASGRVVFSIELRRKP